MEIGFLTAIEAENKRTIPKAAIERSHQKSRVVELFIFYLMYVGFDIFFFEF